jgi:hypothetical protein
MNNTKVFFVQKINKSEYETESLWCKVDGDHFVVDNIPFIAKRVSLGDTILAEYDEDDKQYYFDEFIASSGNTTVRISMYNDHISKIDLTRNWLKNQGCQTEVFLDRNIIAVSIPQAVSYRPIKDYLEAGEGNVWSYEESCLEHKY